MKQERKHRWKRQKNIRALFLFELLCKAAFVMIFYPLCTAALRLLLKLTGYSYLTLENLARFVRQPTTIAVLLLLLLLGSLFYLVETVSLIVFYQGFVKEKKISVVQILFPGLRETVYLLRQKQRFMILFFSLLNALLTLSPMLFVFAIRLKVPAYIARSVTGEAYGALFVIFFLLLCLLVNFFGMYSLYYCVLGEYSFLDSFKKSARVVWRNLTKYIGCCIGLNLLLALLYALVYIGVLLFACYLIYRTKNEEVLMAAMLTAYDEVMVYMGIFITVVTQIVNYAMLARLFSKHGMMLLAGNRIEKFQEQIIYEDSAWQLEYAGSERLHRKMYSRYTKITALIVIVVIFVNVYQIYDAFRNGSLADRETLFGTYITAHRGSSAAAPENTLEALQRAMDDMADFAEIDVQETKDGVVILMHDTSLQRTTGKKAQVSDLTYAQILELDAGGWFHSDYAGVHVPTLEEALKLCKGQINLNIELKAGKSALLNNDLVEKVMHLIDLYDMQNQCMISCTDQMMLARVKEYDSEIKTGYILPFAYGVFYNVDYIDFYSMKSSFVNESMVRTLHSLGKEVHAWTVNSSSEAERMKQLGVDNIITDYPVMVREIVYAEEVRIGFFKLLGLIGH